MIWNIEFTVKENQCKKGEKSLCLKEIVKKRIAPNL